MSTIDVTHRRSASRLSWFLVFVAGAAAVGTVWLRTRGVPVLTAVSLGAQALTGPLFACVGAVIISRRAHHKMGWFLLGLGVASALDELARGIVARQVLPSEEPWMPTLLLLSKVLGGLIWMVYSAFLPLLFPDGDVPSRRWRPVLWSAVGVSVVVSVGILFQEGPLMVWMGEHEVVGVAANPLGVSPAGLDLETVVDAGAAAALLFVFAGLAALVVRWRRDAVTRRQIKWILFGFVAAVAGIVLTAVPALQGAGDVISSLAFAVIPVTMGIAITRYRLFEIDRLVSRTLTYTVVTAILVAIYLGLAVALGAVARAITGESGDLVVALSTLAVAALFQPVLRRTQGLVDRQFNRARYDAARTVEDFARGLRDEVRADAVIARLRGAVAASVDPASVGIVVLRPAEEVTR